MSDARPRAVLISTYELGHQPFGLASPAAWLERAGVDVTCLDLSREPFRAEAVHADLVALHLPMHTAARLAVPLIRRIRRLNPDADVCCYGLYAPPNASLLRSLGVRHILGGEFEADLVDVALDAGSRSGTAATGERDGSRGTPRRAAAAATCAGIARSCPSTAGSFGSCPRRWSWPTSRRRHGPGPSTSRSAIRTSSTPWDTHCGSSRASPARVRG